MNIFVNNLRQEVFTNTTKGFKLELACLLDMLSLSDIDRSKLTIL